MSSIHDYFCLHKYGSQYKVNSATVNVPACLDKITHQLPCMSNEVQLHAVKLKEKLNLQKSLYVPFCKKGYSCGHY